MSNNKLNKALAILISSTKSKKRAISLIHVSKWLKIAINMLGGYHKVAERIGLSPKMLVQFSLVTELHPKVQRLFGERKIDSIDSVVQLKQLNHPDQIIIANLLAKKKINTTDLRAIVQDRKHHPATSIKRIYKNIINSKTKKRYIIEFILIQGQSRSTLLNIFKRHINKNNIIDIKINGALGRLFLTNDGKLELQKFAKDENIPFHDVVAKILGEN